MPLQLAASLAGLILQVILLIIMAAHFKERRAVALITRFLVDRGTPTERWSFKRINHICPGDQVEIEDTHSIFAKILVEEPTK